MKQSGKIVRIVESLGLGWLADSEGKLFSFTFDALPGYSGETVDELGLRLDQRVEFRVESGRVTRVERLNALAAAGGSHSRP